MISIIIPVYNVEKYLSSCVDSIISQLNNDWELLLVDDGSTDSSGVICDKYAILDKRVKVYHLKNGGPGRARNYGLDKAQGEWVLFIDSDDWIDSNLLSISNTAFQNDLIFFSFRRVYDTYEEICNIGLEGSFIGFNAVDGALYNLFIDSNQQFGYTCNKFFKLSIIRKNKIRFEEGLYIKEDEVFTLTYCQHIHSLTVIDKPYYCYRILSNSLSHNEMRYCDYISLAQALEILNKNTPFEALRLAFIQRIMTYYVTALIEMVTHNYPRNIIFKAVAKASSFYKSNEPYVTLPIWQKTILEFNNRFMQNRVIYFVLRLRKLFISISS